MSNQPPKWLDQLLERFCAPELLEEVLGDLHERYYLRVQKEGVNKARKGYWREMLAYMRPSIFKRPTFDNSANNMTMLNNYFTIALRNLSKHKSFAVINVAGLTLGITGALIIFLLVRFELSFDTFHSKTDRIYRVITGSIPDEAESYGTGTPHGLAKILEEDFAEIENVATIYHLNPKKTQIEIDEDIVNNPHTYFSTPSFFEIFDFEWTIGSPQKSLSQPGQAAINESLAKQYFDGDAIGKRIRLNNEFDLVISGVIQDVPKNTDFPIQIAVSHATFAASPKFEEAYSASHGSGYQTYLLLNENTKPAPLEAKFPAMVTNYLGEEVAEKYLAHKLQPLNDIHFDEAFGGGNFSNRAVSKESLWSLTFIGVFILIIACINFVNLATAQANKRAKEVSVRKALGSTRKQLFLQFIGETFALTFIATMMSVSLTLLLLPQLQAWIDIPLDQAMVLQPLVLAWLVGQCVVISLLAGLYPALILSKIQTAMVYKNVLTSSYTSGLLLRKGLVTFQFVIAQLLIFGTIVVVSQNKYFNTQALGYDKEAVIIVDVPQDETNRLKSFRNNLAKHTPVKEVSLSMNAPSATSNKWFNWFWHKSDTEGKLLEVKPIDEYYLDLYDITLLAGEALTESDNGVVVNETLLKAIGITDPEQALQETITIGGQEVTIKGVVQDFHTLSLHQEIYPLILVNMEDRFQLASLKIDLAQASEAISIVEEQWQKMFPDYYFTYRFLDDDIATWYEEERKTSRLLSLFASIAIFIGCLGLYGLISFVTAQRVKEIGIRKVLGATVQHIVYLFTKDFIFLVVIAFVVAAPIGYYFMQQWLADFTYKIDLSWWMFAVAALAGLLIAGITVSFQSIRAALANPVDSLRNE
ncbi:FtsX-like permease family protein [Tunicatimonas pelagia]|uniref:FtsX-like permease family protein n=1 Tax=Tunicatimonas pelagia TaxID=931531 RepID=UPI002666570A|nr:FtsX-like permease family protein [Tunicatimonas pelagia]WKN43660.1 permease prefix domain 2-containing transporter [Tunicatimonas pelagia]